MILTMSIIITVLAALEWIIIRRIPFRIVRILVQVPLLIITFFGAYFYAFTADQNQQVAERAAIEEQIVDVYEVQRGDVVVTVDGTGAILPARQVALIFSASGLPVTDVLVSQGDMVDEGQVLASLDTTDAQQVVDDAQIALDLQQSTLDVLTSPPTPEDIAAAEASLQAAQAQFNAAAATGTTAQQREIARLQTEIARNQLWQAQLSRDGISPPAPISIPPEVGTAIGDPADDIVDATVSGLNAQNQAQYQAQLSQAEVGVDQAEYGVDIADANFASTAGRGADYGSVASANAAIVQAQIAYDRLINGATEFQLQQAALNVRNAELSYEQALYNLEQLQLIAPFSGVVAQISLTPGELPPNNAAVLLIDENRYYVDLPVDETDIVQVQVGQPVLFEVDALPGEIVDGVVTSIAYTPIASQDTGFVAYNVRVEVDPGDAALRPGMTVTGSITVLEQPDVLVIPNAFIRLDRQTGDAFVILRDADGTFYEQLILLGARNEDITEVLAGVDPGVVIYSLPPELVPGATS
ncbi:MAG: HlyD family efflux transporter periplasmic adaptor subunit [Anaerolineae bacterium]|nr:HlyD family efflux transporter periplasmic adaptor subunit [Anaerolineae bacterium]